MRPLGDVRIVAIEQYGAGPWGSLQLADLGAEVIKLEDPATGGDVGRHVPPYQEGEDSLFFEAFNRNKRSISLDLQHPRGREVFEDLVRHCDAVFSNLRGDVPARIGIRYADLAHLNPRIVCCSLSGYGMTGPRSAHPGYDYVLQGLAGWMSVTGEPDGPPTKAGLSVVDFAGGFVAAIAILAGIHQARRDGRGTDCDLSLFDTAVSMLNYPAAWHLTGGFEPARTHHSAHPSIVPFGNFRTADGWIVLACPKEKFFVRLCDALGRPELVTDPRFADFAARRTHRDELTAVLEQLLSARTTDEWLDVLTPLAVPAGPVHTVPEALADPHTTARQMVVETAHPRFGTVRSVAGAVKMDGAIPASGHRPAPRRHGDADHVLSTLLGYDRGRIDTLARSGAFGAEFRGGG